MNRMHAHAHAIMLTILLTGMLSLATNIQPVKAGGTIYIRADGSVNPSTAPIQRNGNIYTFTNNINDSIVVERNDVIIEGAGYTVQGTGSGIGINLTGRSNLAIKNMEIGGFQYGIYLSGSYGINISRNNVTANNWDGVFLNDSFNNTLAGNVITANNMDGIFLSNSSNNTLTGNNVAANDWDGIYLSGSSSNTLTGNVLSDNEYNFGVSGISLSHFIHSIDTSNLVNDKPIYYLINQTDALINPETYPGVGYLGLINCVNVTVERLSLTNNINGLLLVYTSISKIVENSIVNNWDGICLSGSWDNRIYHNNFINNAIQAHDVSWDYPSINVWDDGVEGNYWSNHTGVDLNNDGIGDKPHTVHTNNTDHYPVMGMFHSFNTRLGYVNVISNSTIEDFQYFESNSMIKMYVSNMTASQSFGFCRMCISKGLMSPPYTVTIDDGLTEVLHFNDTMYDNGTHSWIYFSYEHTTHEIVIIRKFPPVDTTPPTISVLSPENKTYLVSDVSLTFTVNESTSWIGYSLDSQNNVTISGNTTIVDLSDGTHTIKVYANDTAGNMGASERVYFTIATPAPFPTWIVAAIVTMIAGVGVAILIYFAKVKEQLRNSNNNSRVSIVPYSTTVHDSNTIGSHSL